MIKRIIRRAKLEYMTVEYIVSCGGPFWKREARRQARELIKEGPYNPL